MSIFSWLWPWQGIKPIRFWCFTTRLKSCPDTKHECFSRPYGTTHLPYGYPGLHPGLNSAVPSGLLRVFPQPLKSCLVQNMSVSAAAKVVPDTKHGFFRSLFSRALVPTDIGVSPASALQSEKS